MSRNRLAYSLISCLALVALEAGIQRAVAQEEVVLDEVNITAQAVPGAVLGDIPSENTLTQRDIRAYGVGTVSELLDEIALQTSSGQSRDGAGPVVLVNGRRISGVNEVGDLPTEAVLRVDILPEEVALKYGYSSDQKVVNVILRRRFAAMTGEGTGGASTEGGNERVRVNGSTTRIRENQRLNVAVTAQRQADITEAQRGITPASDEPQADPAYRTLQASQDSYTANAVFASPLTSQINTSTNLRATHSDNQSLNGQTATDSGEPLDRDGTSTAVRLGSALNLDMTNSWRMSVTGAYDYSQSGTDTERRNATTGELSLDEARSTTNSVEGSVLASRKLFALPAGNLMLSLQGGFQYSHTQSFTTRSQVDDAQTLSRSTGNVRVSLDVPVTKRGGFGGAIGQLTANFNAAATRVSYFDTLTMSGYGLNWSPITGVSFIAAVSEDRRAPTAQQLVNPTVTNFGASVYDYATGQSVLVTSTTGGNPLLVADDRRTIKFGATVKPFTNRNFTVSANYSESRTRNAIQSLTGVSSLMEAAFPGRFVRDEDGVLVSIDTRPVNVASQDRANLRWGFNLTQVLRQPQRPQFGQISPEQRAQFQARRQRDGGSAQRQTPSTTPSPEAAAADGATANSPGASNDQTLDEAVVEGRRVQNEPEPGFGRGFGPPPDGFGRGFGGPDGAGPPPGGFGGPGGPGGPGGGGFGGGGRGPGGGGFGGGDNGAQLQLSVYHTWLISNEVTLREGLAPIDLLAGSTLGGSPPVRHLVQMNGGITDNGLGFRLTGEWRSAGRTLDSTGGVGGLHFGSLGTLDVRLFADLALRFPGKPWARGLRTTLSLQNVFNDRQKVVNDAGVTPQAYQPGYLDPTGRTVMLTLRKIQ